MSYLAPLHASWCELNDGRYIGHSAKCDCDYKLKHVESKKNEKKFDINEYDLDLIEEEDGLKFYWGMDAPGNDIKHVNFKHYGNILVEMKKYPECVGFNTNGWLKFKINIDDLVEEPQFANRKGGIFVKDKGNE